MAATTTTTTGSLLHLLQSWTFALQLNFDGTESYGSFLTLQNGFDRVFSNPSQLKEEFEGYLVPSVQSFVKEGTNGLLLTVNQADHVMMLGEVVFSLVLKSIETSDRLFILRASCLCISGDKTHDALYNFLLLEDSCYERIICSMPQVTEILSQALDHSSDFTVLTLTLESKKEEPKLPKKRQYNPRSSFLSQSTVIVSRFTILISHSLGKLCTLMPTLEEMTLTEEYEGGTIIDSIRKSSIKNCIFLAQREDEVRDIYKMMTTLKKIGSVYDTNEIEYEKAYFKVHREKLAELKARITYLKNYLLTVAEMPADMVTSVEGRQEVERELAETIDYYHKSKESILSKNKLSSLKETDERKTGRSGFSDCEFTDVLSSPQGSNSFVCTDSPSVRPAKRSRTSNTTELSKLATMDTPPHSKNSNNQITFQSPQAAGQDLSEEFILHSPPPSMNSPNNPSLSVTVQRNFTLSPPTPILQDPILNKSVPSEFTFKLDTSFTLSPTHLSKTETKSGNDIELSAISTILFQKKSAEEEFELKDVTADMLGNLRDESIAAGEGEIVVASCIASHQDSHIETTTPLAPKGEPIKDQLQLEIQHSKECNLTEIEFLNMEKEAIEKELKDAHLEIDQIRKEKVECENQMREWKEREIRERDTQHSKTTALEEQLNAQRQLISQYQQGEISDLLVTFEKEKEKLEEKLNAQTEAILQYQAEILSLKNRLEIVLSDFHYNESQREQFVVNQKQLLIKIEQLSTEVEGLRKANEELKQEKKKLEECRLNESKLICLLQSQLMAYKEEEKDKVANLEKLVKMENEVRLLNLLKDELSQKLEETRNDCKITDEIVGLRKSMEAVEKEKFGLLGVLQEARQTCESLQARNEGLVKDNDLLKLESVKSLEEVGSLRKELAEKEKLLNENAKLVTENASLKSMLSQLQRKNAKLLHDNKEQLTELDFLRKEVTDQDKLFIKLDQKAKELTETNELMKTTQSQLQADNNNLKMNYQKASSVIAKLKNDIVKLTSLLEENKENLSAVANKYKKDNEELERTNGELNKNLNDALLQAQQYRSQRNKLIFTLGSDLKLKQTQTNNI